MPGGARTALPARLGWAHWWGALLAGLQLILVLLIASWFLRACAPVKASLNLSVLGPAALPRASSPPDRSAALKASLDEALADEKRLKAEFAALDGEFRKKTESCTQAATPLPAGRWESGDLRVLKGCWLLGRDVRMSHTFVDGRREPIVAKAGRICFGEDGVGQHEQTTVGAGGEWHCKAPITAKFWSNGTLVTSQPDVLCDGSPPAKWAATRLACRRVSDVLAICQATDKSGRTQVEFRREP
jgi:hypothetical protein